MGENRDTRTKAVPETKPGDFEEDSNMENAGNGESKINEDEFLKMKLRKQKSRWVETPEKTEEKGKKQ